MSIPLPPELEQQLRRIAASEGRDIGSLLADPRFVAAFGEAMKRVPRNGANGHHSAPAQTNETPTPADVAAGIDDASFGKSTTAYPLRGKLTRYTDPCEPAFSPDDWDALR